MTSSKKGLKISIIVVLVIFIIFMGLSAVMYFVKPVAQTEDQSQTTGDTTTVEIVSNTGIILSGEMD